MEPEVRDCKAMQYSERIFLCHIRLDLRLPLFQFALYMYMWHYSIMSKFHRHSIFDQVQCVSNSTTVTLDELPSSMLGIMEGELAEAIMLLIQYRSDVQDGLSTQCAVAFNVPGHTVDDMRQGFAVSGEVGIRVDDIVADNCVVV